MGRPPFCFLTTPCFLAFLRAAEASNPSSLPKDPADSSVNKAFCRPPPPRDPNNRRAFATSAAPRRNRGLLLAGKPRTLRAQNRNILPLSPSWILPSPEGRIQQHTRRRIGPICGNSCIALPAGESDPPTPGRNSRNAIIAAQYITTCRGTNLPRGRLHVGGKKWCASR